jgi:hypothetical protein
MHESSLGRSIVAKESLISVERIEQIILLIRGQKVMLDMDLAALYEVPTFGKRSALGRKHRRRKPGRRLSGRSMIS